MPEEEVTLNVTEPGTPAVPAVADPIPTVQPTPSPVVPPAAPPASPAVPSLNPETHAPDGKKWSEKFYGAQGALKQTQNQAAQAKGGLDQQVTVLAQTVQEREAAIAALTQERDALRLQVDSITGLQEQIQQLTQQAMRADRYQMLMEFPQLHNLQVEQQVAGEDGADPTTVTVNPVMQLIETSRMPLDQLKTTLQQFVTTLPSAAEAPRSPVTSPAIPAPTSPQGNDADAAWELIQTTQQAINEGDLTPAAEEANRKAWQDYYELQTPELSG